jgi:hypothetical protein
MDKLSILGRAEAVSFPELGMGDVPSRIDTGAKTSALWVSEIKEEKDGSLSLYLFDKESPYFTGKRVHFDTFKIVAVASSNGYVEERYKIRTVIVIGNRRIRASFTLADRSSQVYPVLIGRNVLAGKFMVNVKAGTPLLEEEREREVTKKLSAKKLKRSKEES